MDKKQNDSLALIVGGLFILALLFTTYNYFNKGRETQESVEKRIQELQTQAEQQEGLEELDNSKDDEANTLSESQEVNQENNESEITENAANDTREELSETETQEIAEYSENVQILTTEETQWIANDYNKGDIQGDTYTVVEGDTLFEIAEAVYGDGSMWVNILYANSSDIGYLSNGTQALIVPGQVLNLVQ